MIYLYSSNRLEILAGKMAEQIGKNRKPDDNDGGGSSLFTPDSRCGAEPGDGAVGETSDRRVQRGLR